MFLIPQNLCSFFRCKGVHVSIFYIMLQNNPLPLLNFKGFDFGRFIRGIQFQPPPNELYGSMTMYWLFRLLVRLDTTSCWRACNDRLDCGHHLFCEHLRHPGQPDEEVHQTLCLIHRQLPLLSIPCKSDCEYLKEDKRFKDLILNCDIYETCHGDSFKLNYILSYIYKSF